MKPTTKKVFAFDRMNFILLAIGMAIVIIGMILMSGSGSDETTFNPAIFDAQHVKVAPQYAFLATSLWSMPSLRNQRIRKRKLSKRLS